MIRTYYFILIALLACLPTSAEQLIQKSEPKVIIDDLEFHSNGGKYCHRSNNGNFWGLYVYSHLSSHDSELKTYQVGVGLLEENELQKVLTLKEVTISEGNKAWFSSADISIPKTIPEGNYRLVLIYRETEDGDWTLCGNSSDYYVEANISENWLVTRCFPLSKEGQNTLDYGLNLIDGVNYDVYSVNGKKEATVYPLDTGKYEGDIYIPNSVKYNNEYFSVVKLSPGCLEDCALESLSLAIPEVDYIGHNNMQKFELREGVATFEFIAHCDRLVSLEFPKSLSEVSYAAMNCISLETIRFNNPKPVTFWGNIEWGEESLPALSDVFFAAAEPPSLGESAEIQIHPTAIIHVPEGRKSSYENAGWKGWNIVEDQPLPEVDYIEWGYCSGDILKSTRGVLNGRGENHIDIAIHVPSEAIDCYIGKQISAIEFYDNKLFWDTGENPMTPDYVFITTSGTDYLTKQAVVDTKKGWNKITLETPYTITGEELYVGIGRYHMLEVNFTDLDATAPDGFWLRVMGNDSLDGWEPLGVWSNYAYGDSNHPISVRFNISGDDLPSDLVLENVQLTSSNGVPLNSPTGAATRSSDDSEGQILMTANVKSRTKDVIRSYTINWQIDGEQAGSHTITTSLPANSVEPISIEIPATLVNRNHTFSYFVTDINGHPDAVSTNSSDVIAFKVPAKQHFPRKFVMEEGTGTWCGWCPYGMVTIDRFLKKYPDNFIAIGIHESDEMGNAENYDKILRLFESFPRCFINRTKQLNPTDYDGADIEELKDLAECQITASAEFANADSTSVTVSTETVFGFADEGADIRIAYVVVEDHVGPYIQANYLSNPEMDVSIINSTYEWDHGEPEVETIFNHVARGIYNDADGVRLSVPSTIIAGETYQYQYTLTLPKNIDNKKNIRIITLLIDNKSGEILNADSYDMVYDDDSETEANTSGFEFKYGGKSLKEGATIVIYAKKDEHGDVFWTTSPTNNPEDGLILATLDGKKSIGEAQSEVLNCSLYTDEEDPLSWLHWYMNNEYIFIIKPKSGYESSGEFTTDDKGVAKVQIYNEYSLQNEGFMDICLSAAIKGYYKIRSVNIKFVYDEATAINNIQNNQKFFDVYSLNGTKLRSRVTSLDGLPHGLYIVNGRKVVK